MKTMKFVVDAPYQDSNLCDEYVTEMIDRNTRGWRLFFSEPIGATYRFLNTFWGCRWDGTPENLKDIIVSGPAVVDNKLKQHLLIFKYDGIDRFVWCSWTKEVYDCFTCTKHQLSGDKMARKITELIGELMLPDNAEVC